MAVAVAAVAAAGSARAAAAKAVAVAVAGVPRPEGMAVRPVWEAASAARTHTGGGGRSRWA